MTGPGHPGVALMSPGHDLSEHCHVLTTIQSPGWLQSPDTAVYTQGNNKNMKILWGRRREEGGELGEEGGQFGKFHFSAMTMQFRSFSKINLIRK